ncbi:MAG: gluconate transporter [Cytophagia bacterium]|nr:gluconate transporter [Cytophagia bacterium]
MENLQLYLAIISGVALLLFLIMKWKLNAFLSLLFSSIWVGLIGGLGTDEIINSISKGMGDTLAFVATIVGLGAIFGALLEHSGGAQALAKYLLKKGGESRSRLALLTTGFIVSIPVFFDVGIIILMPMVKALAKKSNRHVLYYALPLLVGLGITHSFIPPTPGPVAVADILKVDLGYAIIVGSIVGIPIALICGLLVSKKLVPQDEPVEVDDNPEEVSAPVDSQLVHTIMWILGLPIFLILIGSLLKSLANEEIIAQSQFIDLLGFIGHPFVSLLIGTLLALYFLGIKKGVGKDDLFKVTNNSLAPAGSIILITGAGGVLKTVMINTGIGDIIAQGMLNTSFSVLLLAYLVTVLVRIMQGSATVAMLTGAGIVAAVLPGIDLSMPEKTFIMMAIAAGSIVLSHVNDSGFWLVNRMLNQSVQQTLKSWTILSTVISVTSFALIFIMYQFV